ncbi:unnamed protein product [Malus baccata var. baccata]
MYVLRSAVGFTVFTALLLSWALTFAIGGEHLFGHVWDQLVMYNLADRLGLTEAPVSDLHGPKASGHDKEPMAQKGRTTIKNQWRKPFCGVYLPIPS